MPLVMPAEGTTPTPSTRTLPKSSASPTIVHTLVVPTSIAATVSPRIARFLRLLAARTRLLRVGRSTVVRAAAAQVEDVQLSRPHGVQHRLPNGQLVVEAVAVAELDLHPFAGDNGDPRIVAVADARDRLLQMRAGKLADPLGHA